MIRVRIESDGPGWKATATSGPLVIERSVHAISDGSPRRWPSDVPRADGDHALGERLRSTEKLVVLSRELPADALVEYGSHLLRSIIDPARWSDLVEADSGDLIGLELEILDPDLQSCIWEALHDGSEFLALRVDRPVVPIRLVKGSGAARTVTSQPRILFALGVRPEDWRVRGGAEVMGVIEGFGRSALSRGLRSKVVVDASLRSIGDAARSWRPDVVHLIGHGDVGAAGPLLELPAEFNEKPVGVTGVDLAQALVPKPALVVVSACQSGRAASEYSSPIAAQLVAEGVPIAVAMGGDVRDSACRTFTRSLAAVVGRGRPLLEALAAGRRSAMAGGGSSHADWVLPVVFSSQTVPAQYRLVDDRSSGEIRKRLDLLDGEIEPAFVARHDLVSLASDLTDPDHPLAVIALNDQRAPGRRCGGSRLLLELAAAAIRERHLVVSVGPYANQGDAPDSLAELVVDVMRSVGKVCGYYEPPPGLDALVAGMGLEGTDPPRERVAAVAAADPDHLIGLLQALLAKLPARLGDKSKGVVDPAGSTLILFDDVHEYPDAFAPILNVLCGRGLSSGETKVPVGFFAKGAGDKDPVPLLHELRGGSGWLHEEELGLTDDLPRQAERLAFLHWLLFPAAKLVDPPLPALVPPRALLRNDDGKLEPWHVEMRKLTTSASRFYEPKAMAAAGEYGLDEEWLELADDEEHLARLGIESDD